MSAAVAAPSKPLVNGIHAGVDKKPKTRNAARRAKSKAKRAASEAPSTAGESDAEVRWRSAASLDAR
jgi:hypothetical protein